MSSLILRPNYELFLSNYKQHFNIVILSEYLENYGGNGTIRQLGNQVKVVDQRECRKV